MFDFAYVIAQYSLSGVSVGRSSNHISECNSLWLEVFELPEAGNFEFHSSLTIFLKSEKLVLP